MTWIFNNFLSSEFGTSCEGDRNKKTLSFDQVLLIFCLGVQVMAEYFLGAYFAVILAITSTHFYASKIQFFSYLDPFEFAFASSCRVGSDLKNGKHSLTYLSAVRISVAITEILTRPPKWQSDNHDSHANSN